MSTNVLKNKYVFYAIFVIAVANLLGYLAMEDYESLILFVAIYALSTYFSKQTLLNLSIAILGTALLRRSLRREWYWYEKEGFEGGEEGFKEGNALIAAEKAERETDESLETMNSNNDDDDVEPASDEEEDLISKSKNKIDVAGSLEEQYNQLKDILGKDGEKYIAKDANALKERQAQIMEQMQTMAPLMENAKDLLKTFESSGMMKLVDKFMPMIEQVALPGTTGAKN
jgi:hypothetical protein